MPFRNTDCWEPLSSPHGSPIDWVDWRRECIFYEFCSISYAPNDRPSGTRSIAAAPALHARFSAFYNWGYCQRYRSWLQKLLYWIHWPIAWLIICLFWYPSKRAGLRQNRFALKRKYASGECVYLEAAIAELKAAWSRKFSILFLIFDFCNFYFCCSPPVWNIWKFENLYTEIIQKCIIFNIFYNRKLHHVMSKILEIIPYTHKGIVFSIPVVYSSSRRVN